MREGRLPGPVAPGDPVRAPPSACIPRWSASPREALRGHRRRVASVATGFPAGQTSLDVKVEETREAVAAGATEIDMVISREAYLAGDDARVAREIEAVKEACGDAHLKVILETARAADLRARAPRVASSRSTPAPTSSRPRPARSPTGATPGVVLVMLETVRDHF